MSECSGGGLSMQQDARCFGCKSLFVCDERFRCDRRLFLDTMDGPSGFLEVDNVLKASPEWCPGREEIDRVEL